ncbi:adenosine deaminase family protein [Pelagicoccus albus]|uniref:Adenosine deaminase n=1 Tax=Pelagicoccus albus TaxID=415222 RepID=A0A7X1B4K7_9BACT|nr:adenosine deaminase [Pelagicoccus albus]MBC2605432.1 adenosine deaminase [Pelagicoccus albus]
MNPEEPDSSFSRRNFLARSILAGGALGLAAGRLESKPITPAANFEGKRSHRSKSLAPKAKRAPIGQLFETIKKEASREDLYRFLYAMPKGGDLHHHFGGGILPEMWWEVATDRSRNGDQEFYTRYKVSGYGMTSANFHRDSRNSMFWTTVSEHGYHKLSESEKGDFKALTALNEEEKGEWLSSVVLDREFEGRVEFFEYIWPRVSGLLGSIEVMTEVMVENMKRFAAEGVRYLEIQTGPWGWSDSSGRALTADEANQALKDRLTQPDALETGVTLRFQGIVIRFQPNAEDRVEAYYEFIDQNRDFWVGLNMAGREDDNRGYAARFTEVYDKMMRKYPGIGISIHAGEAEKRDTQIFDTLRLGATRIGHGINLYQDDETMQLMRCGKFLVEINLISNEVLGYVPDLDQHPFPIYLRQGIPVCLNTDDRGMWHSNMTDEYFVAVERFNLSWSEMESLGINSLAFSFLAEDEKETLLAEYEEDLNAFAEDCLKRGWKKVVAECEAVTYDYGSKKLGLNL